jgi:uracil-DNA glycosylase
LDLLKEVKLVVALGSFAFTEYLTYLQSLGHIGSRAQFSFGHGVLHRTHAGGPLLLGCYHPSQQNTSTGKLTAVMLADLFSKARRLIEDE